MSADNGFAVARDAKALIPYSRWRTTIFITSLFSIFSVGLPAAGQILERPKGEIILTVDGSITATNQGKEAVFDRDMLNRLGARTLRTSTSWTDGVQTFEGFLARDLMKAVGAKGTSVRATALNDYTIKIPLADFFKYDVLFAMKMNGKILTRRDKGPIWIIYPRDQHRELQNQKVDAKWIWQLVRLQVE